MVEEICPEAASAANDGKAVYGSSSPNQTSRRAPAARRIDPLEMSVKVHTVENTGSWFANEILYCEQVRPLELARHALYSRLFRPKV
jgi:hypothetical protein